VKSRFHEAASEDLLEDITYYDLANPGLGDRLLADVRTAVAFLEAYPLAARVLVGDIRGKALVRFPHTLLYAVEENVVLVLALAHQRQDLQTWLEIIKARRSAG